MRKTSDIISDKNEDLKVETILEKSPKMTT